MTERLDDKSRRPRVGSWPGWTDAPNAMVGNLRDGLTAAGAEVSEVWELWSVDPGRFDVIQLHWAEIAIKSSSGLRQIKDTLKSLLGLRRLKRSGVQIVWVVHNLRPHRLEGMQRLLWPILRQGFCRLADKVVTLSPDTALIVAKAYGTAGRTFHVRHPRYDNASEDGSPGLSSRKGPLYVFFGDVRQNKGADALVSAFLNVRDPEARLVLAGRAEKGEARELQSLAGSDPRIDFRLKFQRRDELEALITSADFVVLPFKDYLHSGSLIDALSLGATVITPRTPFARSVERDVGPDFVRLYDGTLSAEHLKAKPALGRPDMSLYDKGRVGRDLMAIYKAGSPQDA